MGTIGHRNLNNALNRMYSDYERSSRHSGYPQAQEKRSVVNDVADGKDKLSKKLWKGANISIQDEFSVVGSEDGAIYFTSKMSEKHAQRCWYKQDEVYGRITQEGKIESYRIGGPRPEELDDEQLSRIQAIQTIVDSGIESLESELAEDKKFKSEKSFAKRMIATIAGKKPKMEAHKMLKNMLEKLPDDLSKQKTETILDTLKEQIISPDEINEEALDVGEKEKNKTKEMDSGVIGDN